MKSVGGGQATPPGGYGLSDHIARTLRFAFPAMLGRTGLIALITVDTVMTGHAGARELAYYGLSLAPFQILMVTGIGLLAGTPVLVAQRDGAGRSASCGAVWRVGLLLGGALGVVGGFALTFGEPLYLALHQTPEMAAGAADALRMHAWGLPAMMLYLATAFFMEGIGRPAPGMVAALIANLVNLALNWLLIGGELGAPAMGASGAALATSLSRWVMLASLLGYVLLMGEGRRYGVWAGVRDGTRSLRQALRLGTPLAMTTGLEVGAFSLVASFAGRLGDVPMASYQAALNVLALAFMLSLGLAAAAAVRVANAVGRHDGAGMAVAAWVALGLNAALMLVLATGISLFSGPLAALYSSDPAVRSLTAVALYVIAVMIVVDGAQAVLATSLRAVSDVFLPLGIFGLSFWGLGVPLAYVLGLRAGYGVPGLLAAMTLALALASLALAVRFHLLSRRSVRPM